MKRRKDETPVYMLEIKKNVPKNPIVKLYQQKLTYEDKFKLGILTYPEYVQWQQELAEEEAAKNAESEGSTFWSADGGNRDNISNADYNDFLAQNGIDVSNRNSVDFDSLKSQFND
ncbi:MAG: hypothetical protein K6E19_07715 [Lachnospiraceae bacterium]|nr:hypothetical protein [Lachnospiraceae bacterium]